MTIFDSGNKSLILVIDDIKENLKLLGSLLESSGYSVAIASSGEKGEKTAAARNPDLILLDIGLPDISGIEVCKRLKKNMITARIPIIFITARNDADDILEGFAAGAVDYITKPFHQPELLARVKTHIDLKRALEKIEKLSFYDEVSGIPNKRFFNKFFEVEWKRAVREKIPLSIIMLDIDYFKKYNDTYGHIEGDRCLARISKSIERSLERPADFAARFGGEEFICVLPNTDNLGAKKVAEEIRAHIEELKIEHRNSDISKVVTVSLGVNTITPDTYSDMLDFVNMADNALYTSKNNGRNRVT